MFAADTAEDPVVELVSRGVNLAAEAIITHLRAVDAACGAGPRATDPVTIAAAALRSAVVTLRSAGTPEDQVEMATTAAMARFVADHANEMRTQLEGHPLIQTLADTLSPDEQNSMWAGTLAAVWDDADTKAAEIRARPAVDSDDAEGVAALVVFRAAEAANLAMSAAVLSTERDDRVEQRWRIDASRLLPADRAALLPVCAVSRPTQAETTMLLAFDSALLGCVSSRHLLVAAALDSGSTATPILAAGDVVHCCSRAWRWLTLVLSAAPPDAAAEAVAGCSGWAHALSLTAGEALSENPAAAAGAQHAVAKISLRVVDALKDEFSPDTGRPPHPRGPLHLP